MINYNGNLLDRNQNGLSFANRAFRYGDGIFESMRMVNGKIPLLDLHIDRLLRGMKALRTEMPAHFNSDFFREEIEKITLGQFLDLRIRLSVFRTEGGLYTPTDNRPGFLIECTASSGSFPHNEKGISLTFYDEVRISDNHTYNRLAGVKSANALPYVLAAQHARTYGFTESFLFNTREEVAETQASNYYLWDGEKLLTPSLKTGCVAGVMREFLLQNIPNQGMKINEIDSPQPKDIFNAKGILLTNAVQGVLWVRKVDFIEYDKPTCFEAVYQILSELT